MSDGSPAVAVVLPTHQRREMVRRAAASVLTQTVHDLELVVVDDGSTDGTGEALADTDPRLTYIWQENAGPAAARNRGVAATTAPVIAFLDSDNVWLPDHLEVVLAVLARHPGAVLATTCPEYLTVGRRPAARASSGDALLDLVRRGRVGYLSCVAVRREAFDAVGGFDERMPVFEDSDLWLRLSALGDVARLRRRTVRRSRSGRSQQETGRRSGGYLEAVTLSAESMNQTIARHRPGAPLEVTAAARAQRHWAAAEAALACGDRNALRDELQAACRDDPALSDQPEMGTWRLRAHLPDGHDTGLMAGHMVALAEEWPDARCDTALYLRLAGASAAARSRRPRLAMRALRGLSVPRVPGMAARSAPVLVLGMRRMLQKRREGAAA